MSEPISQPSLVITTTAINRIRELINLNEKFSLENTYLKISILGGGCGGKQYSLEFKDKKDLNFLEITQFQFEDLKVAANTNQLAAINNLILDFYMDNEKSGFIFEQQVTYTTCNGCSGGCSV